MGERSVSHAARDRPCHPSSGRRGPGGVAQGAPGEAEGAAHTSLEALASSGPDGVDMSTPLPQKRLPCGSGVPSSGVDCHAMPTRLSMISLSTQDAYSCERGRTSRVGSAAAMQRDLVVRAKRGDHDAFTRLVDGSLDRPYTVANLILHDADRAQDAVQEALVSARRDLPPRQAS